MLIPTNSDMFIQTNWPVAVASRLMDWVELHGFGTANDLIRFAREDELFLNKRKTCDNIIESKGKRIFVLHALKLHRNAAKLSQHG